MPRGVAVLGKPNTNASGGGMHGFLLEFDASKVPRGEVESASLSLRMGDVRADTTGKHHLEHAPPHRVVGSIMEDDVTSVVAGKSPVSFRVASLHIHKAVYASRESKYAPPFVMQCVNTDREDE